MMLCKADFQELFPESFATTRDTAGNSHSPGPSATCLARWEDDGGRPHTQPERHAEVAARPAAARYRATNPLGAGAALATMPAAAAYGAVWAMLTTYNRMARS